MKKLSTAAERDDNEPQSHSTLRDITFRFHSHIFLAFIPVYDYEKRVMNDKYASCVYIDIVYSGSSVITARKTRARGNVSLLAPPHRNR